MTKCDAPLPCGHICTLMAHDVDIEHRTTNWCKALCNTTLRCGHVCASLCHDVDPEHTALYRCPIQCEGTLLCGHPCPIRIAKHGCSKHKPCLAKCGFTLPCGHSCSLVCHYSVSEHMKCSLCSTKPSEPLPPSNGEAGDDTLNHPTIPIIDPEVTIDQQNGSVGSISVVPTRLIPPGHTCRVGGACTRKCRALLSCGHSCSLRCHGEFMHAATDTCKLCSTMSLEEDLSPLEFDQGKGTPFSLCCHYVEASDCDKLCGGRLCGHSCGLDDAHTCSEHIKVDKMSCSERCTTLLPCKHECIKSCHAGNNRHECSTHAQCANAVKVEMAKEWIILYPAHNHVSDGRCTKKCKSVLSCGHKCTMQCNLHMQFPHVASHRCMQCTLSDTLLKELSVLGVPFSKETPSDYCSHLVKGYECGRVCEGRRCEHPCELPAPHLCKEHVARDRIVCKFKCRMKISCGHACYKTCHIGDYEHKCRRMAKDNKTVCIKAQGSDGQDDKENRWGEEQKGQVDSKDPERGWSICGGMPLLKNNTSDQEKSSDAEVISAADVEENAWEPEQGVTADVSMSNGVVLPHILREESLPKVETGPAVMRTALENDTPLVNGEETVVDDSVDDQVSQITLDESEGVPLCSSAVRCPHTCNQCQSCSSADRLASELRSLQINIPISTAFNRCSHFIKMYECEQICKGRLCGHHCGLKKPHHLCLDHVALNKVSCREACGAELSCGRRCYRFCHIGDGCHLCEDDTGVLGPSLDEAEIGSHVTA